MTNAMRSLVAIALMLLALPALAGETGDAVIAAAYDGSLAQERDGFAAKCDTDDREACFGAGLGELSFAYERLSQFLYRHGATVPGNTAAALIFGIGSMDAGDTGPINPDPQPLSYEALRTVLDETIASLDTARGLFERAGESGDYVIVLDPLRVRLDVDGDGKTGADETFAPFAAALFGSGADELTEKQKSKGVTGLSLGIGLDRADALWLAGYS